MVSCPICGHKNDLEATVCANPKCGEDLLSFAKLYFFPAIYFNKGLEAAQNSRFEEAIAFLSVACASDQGDVNALILLGKVHAQKGDYKSAIEQWQRVLKMMPSNTFVKENIERAQRLLAHSEEQRAKTSTVKQLPLPESESRGRKYIFPFLYRVSGFLLLCIMVGIVAFLEGRYSIGQRKVALESSSVISNSKSQVKTSLDRQGEIFALLEKIGVPKKDIEVEQTGNRVRLKGAISEDSYQDLAENLANRSGNLLPVDLSQLEIQKKYHVRRGDTLSTIASLHFGNAKEWQRIYDLNRDILTDPNQLQVGQILWLPAHQ